MRKKNSEAPVKEQIRQLMQRFSDAAVGLFEISGRYESTYEQGIYGCAIAKPTKRMKAALGIDREVLVVTSTFRDQQQRTIKFVKKEIDQSEGRYENTIAVVVHGDSEGDTKLKNWGRDKGVAILPISASSDFSSSVDLERMLCAELYSHDSFDVTGPVSDDQNFYGRRDEAMDLARKLQKGQIRSCLGVRKVGKTSIINRVLREIRENYQCISLMVDCSRDDVWGLSAAQLINSIAATIHGAISQSKNYASIDPTSVAIDIKSARTLLEDAVLLCPVPLILVFDEIDYITPGSPTEPFWKKEFNPFWRNLRAVYQECDRQGHVVSILVGGVSTYWFTVESIDQVENAALAFVPEEYLSPMPEGATVAMLRRLGRISGMQIDDDAAAVIASATGNMPYWARKCGSYIHRHVPISTRPSPIDAERVTPLVEAFVAEEGAAIAEVALKHLFRVHPSLFDATLRCHRGESSLVSEALRRSLRRYGVLSIKEQLSGAMLTRAFSSLVASSQIAPQTATDEVSEVSRDRGIGEWAEELAALGKRRNILERKLREMVVNFVRFDALAAGKNAEVRERIVSVLPENQRNALRHLSAEEAMLKFLWTDLVKLIVKEWVLFGRIFGDKAQFVQNSEIINDRYDAHAKDADSADFALYRRALSHLEVRMAKLHQ